MKIHDIKAYPIQCDVQTAFTSATGWRKTRGTVLVEVVGDGEARRDVQRREPGGGHGRQRLAFGRSIGYSASQEDGLLGGDRNGERAAVKRQFAFGVVAWCAGDEVVDDVGDGAGGALTSFRTKA